MMTTGDALHAALSRDPDDDHAWLVLADWLEEDGQPARAELLRLTRTLRGVAWNESERPRLERRVVELLNSGAEPANPVLTNRVGMRFRLVPPGRFLMGAPDDEVGSTDDERPRHEVTLTRPLWLSETPVTQAQYEAVTGRNPSHFSRSGDGKDEVRNQDTSDFPVENVSSDEAMEFCDMLSERDAPALGRRYRLPSEAEWEYGCRAGPTSYSPFHFGPVLDDSHTQANFDGRAPHGSARQSPCLRRTCPVRRYPPNAFGLFDLHGNVEEWCADWSDDGYYAVSPKDDPPGPPEPTLSRDRVPRGGCWGSHAVDCRSACRNAVSARRTRYRSDTVGFRAALVVSAPFDRKRGEGQVSYYSWVRIDRSPDESVTDAMLLAEARVWLEQGGWAADDVLSCIAPGFESSSPTRIKALRCSDLTRMFRAISRKYPTVTLRIWGHGEDAKDVWTRELRGGEVMFERGPFSTS
jgi:uncharacterized protein (TIGR02996 family)